MKKYFLLLLSAAFFVSFYFADTIKQIATKKIWETSGLATPESVCFDSIRNQFYVSNINGKPSAVSLPPKTETDLLANWTVWEISLP